MLAGVVALLGCAEPAAPGDTGSTPGCPEVTEALLVAATAVECSANRARFSADLTGISGGGELLIVDPADPPWTELHDLATAARDGCGASSTVSVSLQTGSPLERDVSTPLGCDAFLGAGLTYAFAVYDPRAVDDPGHPVVADCVAVGADPQGLIDGSYDAMFVTEPSFSVRDCRAR